MSWNKLRYIPKYRLPELVCGTKVICVRWAYYGVAPEVFSCTVYHLVTDSVMWVIDSKNSHKCLAVENHTDCYVADRFVRWGLLYVLG